MAAMIACIAGEEITRQWSDGQLAGEELGRRETPFGLSGPIYHVTNHERPFYALARYGSGLAKPAPHRINNRANIYALKDLGAAGVLAWGPGGAITHDLAVGNLVMLSDLIDQTFLRNQTFFADCALGYLRQFPVFCPALSRVAAEAAGRVNLAHHTAGTAAVREGPRLETPAEIRTLAAVGAALVTHLFVPEVFLARELQMCYAAACYVVNYAETGSRHRPFAAGGLFGGLVTATDAERVTATVRRMGELVSAVAAAAEAGDLSCDCAATMARNVEVYGLSDDWRTWLDAAP
ncbi:MAG: MTAP family purine nucleoside phosphorylase [Phycisphaerae bacterium]|nr:MTAP family purine nucleoside phosphorylase [Phycisphaerae bacterium]